MVLCDIKNTCKSCPILFIGLNTKIPAKVVKCDIFQIIIFLKIAVRFLLILFRYFLGGGLSTWLHLGFYGNAPGPTYNKLESTWNNLQQARNDLKWPTTSKKWLEMTYNEQETTWNNLEWARNDMKRPTVSKKRPKTTYNLNNLKRPAKNRF